MLAVPVITSINVDVDAVIDDTVISGSPVNPSAVVAVATRLPVTVAPADTIKSPVLIVSASNLVQ